MIGIDLNQPIQFGWASLRYFRKNEKHVNDGEFSYPAIIADQNHLYITYTWRRKKICFAELEEC